MVSLKGREEPTTTERVSIVVDETASGTGILKSVLAVEHHEFRLSDGNRLLAFHHAHHRLNPMRCAFHIAIEQYIVVGLKSKESLIVAFCKAVILVQQYQFYLRIVMLEECHGIIGRPIVGHHHFGCHFYLRSIGHMPASLGLTIQE